MKYYLITFKWPTDRLPCNLLINVSPATWVVDYQTRGMDLPPVLLFAIEISKKDFDSCKDLHWVDNIEEV